MSRFYSESKDKPAEEAKEESKGEADQVSELKKSLEAKETEAREWKVSYISPLQCLSC